MYLTVNDPITIYFLGISLPHEICVKLVLLRTYLTYPKRVKHAWWDRTNG